MDLISITVCVVNCGSVKTEPQLLNMVDRQAELIPDIVVLNENVAKF